MGEGDEAGPAEAAERKFRAKRTNEQLKLFASLMNTLAAAVIATAVIVPTIRAEVVPNSLDRPAWVLVGFVLHIVGSACAAPRHAPGGVSMSTLELVLTMTFVAAAGGAYVWWQVAAFDREFGKEPRRTPKRAGGQP